MVMKGFREAWDSVYIALKTHSEELGLDPNAVLQDHPLMDTSGTESTLGVYVFCLPSDDDYVDSFSNSNEVDAVEISIFVSASANALYNSICLSVEKAIEIRKFLLSAKANLNLRARENSRPRPEAQKSDKSIFSFTLFAEYAL